jgi:membrane fusion protein, multidrug efflux system
MTTAQPKNTRRKFAINFKHPLVITGLVLLIIVAIKLISVGLVIIKMVTNPRPPASVSTVVVQADGWQRTLSAATSLQSPVGALLKSEVAATVKAIPLSPGTQVAKGDLLIELDADTQQAELKSAQAKLRLATINLVRARDLRAQGVNTPSDLDTAEATAAQAEGEAEEIMASIAKREIRAPFAGRVGIPQVEVGKYITPGTPLVALEAQGQINADFAVAQRYLPLIKLRGKAYLTLDAYPNERFEGVIAGIDPQLSIDTRTLSIRATFPNSEGKLVSGMFGAIEVELAERVEGIVVPQIAITHSAYGDSIYVLTRSTDPKKKTEILQVKQAFVKLGETLGDYVVVLSGIQAGDEVVIAGQMKLRNGDPVRIDNKELPSFSKNPSPVES